MQSRSLHTLLHNLLFESIALQIVGSFQPPDNYRRALRVEKFRRNLSGWCSVNPPRPYSPSLMSYSYPLCRLLMPVENLWRVRFDLAVLFLDRSHGSASVFERVVRRLATDPTQLVLRQIAIQQWRWP